MRYWGMLTAAVAAAVLAVASFAGSGAANHPGSQTLTFTESSRGDFFRFIDQRPRSRGPRNNPSISAGDEVILGSVLLDQNDQRAGRLEASCKAVRGARRFPQALWGCHAFARLGGGTLVLAATLQFRQDAITGAVTGGTGAYEGASGSFGISGEPSVDTFHIARPGF
jgi:hypothetical protein